MSCPCPWAVYNRWTALDWTGLERWTGLRIYIIFQREIRACVELLNSTCIRLGYCTACVKVEVRALYIVRHGVVRGEQRRSYCFGQPPFLGQGAGSPIKVLSSPESAQKCRYGSYENMCTFYSHKQLPSRAMVTDLSGGVS